MIDWFSIADFFATMGYIRLDMSNPSYVSIVHTPHNFEPCTHLGYFIAIHYHLETRFQIFSHYVTKSDVFYGIETYVVEPCPQREI